MVYGFVKQSGGHIEICGAVGHGTTIRLYLPRAQPDLAAAVASPPEHTVQETPSATVLVVEDNHDVRHFVVTQRSEERRVGKECVSTCRARGSAEHKKKKK